MAAEKGRIIGIDLGTTFSAMACLDRHGVPVTLRNAEGELTTPSVVLFEADGSIIVGREARRAAMVYPDRVATCVKRDMGENLYTHPIAGKKLAPPLIAGCILKKLKQDAEKQIGPVAGAVITVPAYFDEGRREATVDAGRIAGLNVLDIVNEPTAAALAYAFRGFVDRGGSPTDVPTMATATTAPSVALVYDLGGGTFDVTIIRIQGDTIRVVATDGDVRLGGRDWDERIVNAAAEAFKEQHGLDPREDPQALQDLYLICEEAKKDLSKRETTRLAVNHMGRRLMVQLTREKFEDLTSDLLYRTENRVGRVIEQANLDWGQVNDVLLVGGSTRMPQVREMLARLTGKTPNDQLSVDEVVAHGAAIHGAILRVGSGRKGEAPEAVLMDGPPDEEAPVVLKPAEPAGGSPAAQPKAQPKPAKRPEPLDADVLEALDAFDQDISEVLGSVSTVNVNAHSLGVAVKSPQTGEEFNSVLIPRNTPLPASRRNMYGTVREGQRYVKVRVLEGESRDIGACITIGECVVSPLPEGLPKGAPISVTFTYDNSGRLHVRAKDETSGLTAQSEIIRTGAMTDQQVQKARETMSRVSVL